jgi:hypothetical protein
MLHTFNKGFRYLARLSFEKTLDDGQLGVKECILTFVFQA